MSHIPANQTFVSVEPYVARHASLVEVHHALAGSLHAVASMAAKSPLEVLVPQALATGRFLLRHHEDESTILFPAIRRLGRLRSADASFLDTCDREHRELQTLCERMLANASSPHPVATEIAILTHETLIVMAAHVREEEAGLAPERLRAMVGVGGLEEIGRELEKLRRR